MLMCVRVYVYEKSFCKMKIAFQFAICCGLCNLRLIMSFTRNVALSHSLVRSLLRSVVRLSSNVLERMSTESRKGVQ